MKISHIVKVYAHDLASNPICRKGVGARDGYSERDCFASGWAVTFHAFKAIDHRKVRPYLFCNARYVSVGFFDP